MVFEWMNTSICVFLSITIAELVRRMKILRDNDSGEPIQLWGLYSLETIRSGHLNVIRSRGTLTDNTFYEMNWKIGKIMTANKEPHSESNADISYLSRNKK